MNKEQAAATQQGIDNAWDGTPEEYQEAALIFIENYARQNLYFDGGMVLNAWRISGDPVAQADWRNRWGAAITQARKAGWIQKAGRIPPKSRQSHTTSLVLWESRIYIGTAERMPTGRQLIIELKRKVRCKEMGLIDALWKAYEFGVEDKTFK